MYLGHVSYSRVMEERCFGGANIAFFAREKKWQQFKFITLFFLAFLAFKQKYCLLQLFCLFLFLYFRSICKPYVRYVALCVCVLLCSKTIFCLNNTLFFRGVNSIWLTCKDPLRLPVPDCEVLANDIIPSPTHARARTYSQLSRHPDQNGNKSRTVQRTLLLLLLSLFLPRSYWWDTPSKLKLYQYVSIPSLVKTPFCTSSLLVSVLKAQNIHAQLLPHPPPPTS